MSASKKAKELGLKSLAQMMMVSGEARSTLEDWQRDRPIRFEILAFGCKKILESIPYEWSHEYLVDHPLHHCFVHEDYAPDCEDADSKNIVMSSTFIEGLNEIKERTK